MEVNYIMVGSIKDNKHKDLLVKKDGISKWNICLIEIKIDDIAKEMT